jgi:hypothetical protein
MSYKLLCSQPSQPVGLSRPVLSPVSIKNHTHAISSHAVTVAVCALRRGLLMWMLTALCSCKGCCHTRKQHQVRSDRLFTDSELSEASRHHSHARKASTSACSRSRKKLHQRERQTPNRHQNGPAEAHSESNKKGGHALRGRSRIQNHSYCRNKEVLGEPQRSHSRGSPTADTSHFSHKQYIRDGRRSPDPHSSARRHHKAGGSERSRSRDSDWPRSSLGPKQHRSRSLEPKRSGKREYQSSQRSKKSKEGTTQEQEARDKWDNRARQHCRNESCLAAGDREAQARGRGIQAHLHRHHKERKEHRKTCTGSISSDGDVDTQLDDTQPEQIVVAILDHGKDG